MGEGFKSAAEQRDELRTRLALLQRRAVRFKEADREIFSTNRLFDLFDLAEEIWIECEQLKTKAENDSPALVAGLAATQREVLLHFILSSLGYLPSHSSGHGGAVTNKTRLLQVASKATKMGLHHQELSDEIGCFASYMDECFDAAIELPELKEIGTRPRKRFKKPKPFESE